LVTDVAVAVGAVSLIPALRDRAGRTSVAAVDTGGVVEETLSGLAAFVVPGPDPYSVTQGSTTPEPGAVDAEVVPALIAGLDVAQDGQPALAASIADLLNAVAVAVCPEVANSPFTSAFANLGSMTRRRCSPPSKATPSGRRIAR
jgi:hypothetical protein